MVNRTADSPSARVTHAESVAWFLDCAGPDTTEVAGVLALLDEGSQRQTAGGMTFDDVTRLPARLTGADPARVLG